ncbi:hypothetical protein BV22DRAFT_548888 [Leucogyrophana mollusca]|uniref:Uncharacterized protein n=1 Tax=Leucogyrophana mollusca TaxID=85980 RepID=A0ACB8BHB9_9AGAM|nr:hypothetical protein BV22DRAFT_548888 [Leucogyrophana mollusca]
MVDYIQLIRVVATASHSIAISCTIFRLSYRWYMRHFWWEDAWASLALLADVVCLICTWLSLPVSGPMVPVNGPIGGYPAMPPIAVVANWLLVVAFTSVPWSARLSVISSVIRVVNPEPKLHRFAFWAAASFGAMWIALVSQKLYACVHNACIIGRSVAISQLINTVSDIILVAMPFHLLRGVKLSRKRRILMSCTFSASLLITAVTIIHCGLLFESTTFVTTIVAHVKAALSLIVCNLLVIVAFIYRVFHKNGDIDLDHSFVDSEAVHFTTIDLTQLTDSRGGVETNAGSFTAQVTVGSAGEKSV